MPPQVSRILSVSRTLPGIRRNTLNARRNRGRERLRYARPIRCWDVGTRRFGSASPWESPVAEVDPPRRLLGREAHVAKPATMPRRSLPALSEIRDRSGTFDVSDSAQLCPDGPAYTSVRSTFVNGCGHVDSFALSRFLETPRRRP